MAVFLIFLVVTTISNRRGIVPAPEQLGTHIPVKVFSILINDIISLF